METAVQQTAYLYPPETTFVRTKAGVEATLASDRSNLPEELWHLLSYVNGRITIDKHRKMFAGSEAVIRHGSIDNCFSILEQSGFLAVQSAKVDPVVAYEQDTSTMEPEPEAPAGGGPRLSNDEELIVQKCLSVITEVVQRDLDDLTWELLLDLEACTTANALRSKVVEIANEHKKRLSRQSKHAVKEVVNQLSALK